ncbi:putative phospholipase D [Dioscorea sansibarensis]
MDSSHGPSSEYMPDQAVDGGVSGDPVLLHGDLELWIIEARSLPNMDVFSERFRRCFVPCRSLLSTATRSISDPQKQQQEHHHHRKIITSDPYVKVSIAGATVARTRVISNSQDPRWDEHFAIPLAHFARFIEFQAKDNDTFGAQVIGAVRVPAAQVASGKVIEDWFQVIGSTGRPPKPDSALHLRMQFFPVESNPLYGNGVAGDPEKKGIGGTYFPLRKGCSLKLYQDAHVRDGELPPIELENDAVYEQGKCWEDICNAILEAHHLIYIVGWSVFTEVRLVREPPRDPSSPESYTLGDLLKYKSQEGVRVCLLVWDDKTSHDKLCFKTAGLMQTHDEETRKFFKHSSVICELSPRYGSSKLSLFKQQVVGNLFTHHQKCVLVDTQASRNKRKITAFVGGLDLCDGRYDTPQHRIFSDLDTVFANDFHNPTFASATKGPRQPWHDLHSKIEGPAAYDVLKNFEQRWRKATKWKEFGKRFRKVSRWSDDALIKLERISWILSPSPAVPDDSQSLWVSEEEDSSTWHVQVLRSIDSGSVKGFPKTVQDAEKKNLICGKNLVIDKSIHTAYVKAIRSAQNFIYIENQYFIGSSFAWPSYKNAGASNLVPIELALKIVSKIKARERFAVYIIIPMWPEGVPTDSSVQEILFWQGQTMQMMYDIVGQELKSMNIENAHPEDYLNFYCLGNREECPKDSMQATDQPSEKSPVALAQKFRRFMIYVHSKGMIIDDEYVLLGSANINQRSLDGSRDTEIAMGAYQPHHTLAEKRRHPHGQVYGYRMSLWAEHLASLDPSFKEPNSLDCVQCVNRIAEQNRDNFAAEEYKPLQGHLLKYPIKVNADGKIESFWETFPDVGGKVLGSPTSLPDTLTV